MAENFPQFPIDVSKEPPGKALPWCAVPKAPEGTLPPDFVVDKMPIKKVERQYIDISPAKDGFVKKEVTRKGEGPLPLHGCKVSMQLTMVDISVPNPLEGGLIMPPKDHSWRLGEGKRCELLELGVCSMRLNEQCVIESSNAAIFEDLVLKIPKSCGKLQVAINLNKIEGLASLETNEQTLTWAEEQIGLASECFKAGKTHLALLKYGLIQDELAKDPWRGETPEELGDLEEYEKGKDIQKRCALNRAACYTRLSMWQDCRSACDEVLAQDSGSVKALFRRGQASMRLGDLASSQCDLTVALEKDPGNREAAQLLEKVKNGMQRAACKDELKKHRKGEIKQSSKWD